MAIKVTRKLVEAKTRERMTDRERLVKKRLVALLRDDGKGHHHAMYAKRLEFFDLQIVPMAINPMFAASISFETGIIRIGESFILDLEDDFQLTQLNVLIRHELAHAFLMHQIRMAYKLGDERYVKVKFSQSLNMLNNIIADDEISNKKYSVEDKEIVRAMTINGKVVGGLVTEDHRPGWQLLSIEEMYDLLCKEIEEAEAKILSGKRLRDLSGELRASDEVGIRVLDTFGIYANVDSESIISDTLESFIDKGYHIDDDTVLEGRFKEIVDIIFNTLKEDIPSDAELKELLNKIAKTSPIRDVDLFGDNKLVLYTPEEKYLALEVLKKFRSDFNAWYDRVTSKLSALNTEELRELIDLLG